MKLDPKTFNPKLHKVTLRGKPVEIVGFSLDDKYAFCHFGDDLFFSYTLESFEVTKIKRFRVGLFTFGVSAVVTEELSYEKYSNFIKWLTDWTEYDV